MKLTKALQASLSQLGSARFPSTAEMDDQPHKDVLKLETLGLVRLVPRCMRPRERGKCRGRLIGYDVLLTPAGKALLP